MLIHSVMITYNRLELTKQAIASYLETRNGGTLIVVDNGSTDGTSEWLWENEQALAGVFDVSLLGENRYPGYATNRGWEEAPEDARFLHRADNDFVFLPGWQDEVLARFAENPLLGQLGLRTDDEELHNPRNVGGNCVIRRELWDAGLRYDERPWPKIAAKVPGYTEDSFMSPRVRKMGWEWGRVQRPCIVDIAGTPGDGRYDDYFAQTWADRGIG